MRSPKTKSVAAMAADGASPSRRRLSGGISELKKKHSDDVEERLKAIACHLFALRGVDGVTIREMLDAAKVKNFGAIGYYFGSKENLVRQILIDGTREIDQRRGELLDALEASGKALDIADIIHVLIRAIIDLPEIQDRRFICFSLLVSMTHRDLYVTTMFEQPNIHFSRCMAHLKHLMPPMPESALHQRLTFLKSSMAMALARREAALTSHGGASNEWAFDHTLRHYIRSETVMLAAPFDDGDWPATDRMPIRDVGIVTHDPL